MLFQHLSRPAGYAWTVAAVVSGGLGACIPGGFRGLPVHPGLIWGAVLGTCGSLIAGPIVAIFVSAVVSCGDDESGMSVELYLAGLRNWHLAVLRLATSIIICTALIVVSAVSGALAGVADSLASGASIILGTRTEFSLPIGTLAASQLGVIVVTWLLSITTKRLRTTAAIAVTLPLSFFALLPYAKDHAATTLLMKLHPLAGIWSRLYSHGSYRLELPMSSGTAAAVSGIWVACLLVLASRSVGRPPPRP